MPFLNNSFENGTLIIGEALDWTQTCSTSVKLSGFGENNDPIELFTWGEFISDISSGFKCLFNENTEQTEDFQWGLFFIEEWYSAWTVNTQDDFVWDVFDNIFVPGITFGSEVFDWSVFDDIFSPGATCLFEGLIAPIPYEDFEIGW